MITPISQTNPCNVSFGYKWNVKTAWQKGQLPSVTKGFYGDVLELGNVTIEHLKPVSKGGKTREANLVLASAKKNMVRGNSDIRQYINEDAAKEYLEQFKDVKLPKFDGNKYVDAIKNTLKTLGVNLGKK